MVVLLFWILCCVGVSIVASNKGRSSVGYFFLAFFLSPLIGLIVVLLVKPNRRVAEERAIETGEMRKCPACAELVKAEATICRYCGRELPKVPTLIEQATVDHRINFSTEPRK